MRCPNCESDDLSFGGPGYLADRAEGQPDTPLVCEDCGWKGIEAEVSGQYCQTCLERRLGEAEAGIAARDQLIAVLDEKAKEEER